MEDFKGEVIKFVKEFNASKGRVPFISEILHGFKINRVKLYKYFPGKMAEICRLAGVSVPEDRLRRVRSALNAQAKKRNVEQLESGKGVEDKIFREFDASIKDYKTKIRILEAEAIADPSKTPEYIREVIPRLDPDLWKSLKRTCKVFRIDLDELIIKLVSEIPYAEYVKTSIIRGEGSPNFKKYIQYLLNKWFESYDVRSNIIDAMFPPHKKISYLRLL